MGWKLTENSHDEMKDLRCMTFTSKGTSEILVAGWQEQMFTIDVDKGTITKQVEEHIALWILGISAKALDPNI